MVEDLAATPPDESVRKVRRSKAQKVTRRMKKRTPEPNDKAPPRDLGHEAYVTLRQAIRDGTLTPGTRVTETDLSDKLKMSRTPVREAIYRLESDGLLTHEPRRGLVVTRPDHQMIMELYAMREAMEGTAARLAAQHASDIEIEALSDLVSSEAKHFGDPRELDRINKRIHALISLSAHNRYLLRSLEVMSSTMSLLPTMLGDPVRADMAHREHMAMVGAIRVRDPEGAEEAAREHIRSARRHRLNCFMSDETT